MKTLSQTQFLLYIPHGSDESAKRLKINDRKADLYIPHGSDERKA